jgi:hypothetical protein
MKKVSFKKAGAVLLLGFSITALSKINSTTENKSYTKMSSEVATENQAQLADKLGGGSFWQGVGGAAGGLLGGWAGTAIGGPWGGYVGVILGAGGGAW